MSCAGFKPTLMFQNETVTDQLTQKFFWGTHGGIGGSELTELENGKITLRFTVDEMKRRGLRLDIDDDIVPDYPETAAEDKTLTAGKGGVFGVLTAVRGRFIRSVRDVRDVHHTVVERFQKNRLWRPEALMAIEKALLGADVNQLK